MAALLEHLVDISRRFSDVVRWSETWDVEEHDPLYDDGPTHDEVAYDLWA